MQKTALRLNDVLPGTQAPFDHLLTDPVLAARYQQAPYNNSHSIFNTMDLLREVRGLTDLKEINALKGELAAVARGEKLLLQAGLCAEDMTLAQDRDALDAYVENFKTMMHETGDAMTVATDKPVVLIGRVAGQLSKPRSNSHEIVDGKEILTYRGEMVHGVSPQDRMPKPGRILEAYEYSHKVLGRLHADETEETRIFASHEALHLPYEYGLMREENGTVYAGSAPLIWIGERTRQLDGPHVAYARNVANPVAVKLGPTIKPEEAIALVETLNPKHEEGKLALIFRMGAGKVDQNLPPLLDALSVYAGKIVFMCDAVHGNTHTDAETDLKTRDVSDVAYEARRFAELTAERHIPGTALHLEAAGEMVTECKGCGVDSLRENYATACDPCLNPVQSAHVAAVFGNAYAQARLEPQMV